MKPASTKETNMVEATFAKPCINPLDEGEKQSNKSRIEDWLKNVQEENKRNDQISDDDFYLLA